MNGSKWILVSCIGVPLLSAVAMVSFLLGMEAGETQSTARDDLYKVQWEIFVKNGGMVSTPVVLVGGQGFALFEMPQGLEAVPTHHLELVGLETPAFVMGGPQHMTLGKFIFKRHTPHGPELVRVLPGGEAEHYRLIFMPGLPSRAPPIQPSLTLVRDFSR